MIAPFTAPEEFSGTPRFVIRRRLGEGGMGVVYAAFDVARGEVVALKVLRKFDADGLRRLKLEFRSLADIHHPNLVTLHELVSADDHWFFTMELIDGCTLTQFVRRAHFIGETVGETTAETDGDESLEIDVDPDRLRRCLIQLVAGISALHGAGKLHCDLKPSNVLVGHGGRTVILDFGIVTDIAEQSRGREKRRSISGTPEYMAPEQGAGRPLSPASDWYAVGVILYEILTGDPPFLGEPRAILESKLARAPKKPSEVVGNVPADLEALCMALLQRDPLRRPDAAEILDALGAGRGGGATLFDRADLALFGREEPIAALESAFRDVTAGDSVAVFVRGASGIGKSALMRTFIDRIRKQRRGLVLAGRCHERELLPFKAVDGIVDALATHLYALPAPELEALAPANLDVLSRVFPVLCELSARIRTNRAEPPADPLERRTRAFDALRALITALAEKAPIVIAIDDLQWGDADSVALLAHLMRRPDPPRVLLLVLHTMESRAIPDQLEAALADGARARGSAFRELDIAPLGRADSIALALEVLGRDAGERTERAEQIAEVAGGNPFFVRELALADTEADAAGLDSPAATLDGVFVRRFARLPASAIELLQLIAVAGQPITEGVLFRAARSRADVRRGVRQLCATSLARSRSDLGAGRVQPYHDRIRAAVVERLSPEERAALHGSLADALEWTGDGDAETLARHLVGAGRSGDAAIYFEQAADQAARAMAFERAAELYQRTIELRPDLGEVRSGLFKRLGTALENAGRGADAADAFLAAAQLEKGAPACELRRRSAEQLLRSGRIDEGLSVLREVLAEVGLALASTPARAMISFAARRLQLRVRGLAFEARPREQIPEEDLARIDACWSVVVGLSTVDAVRSADFQTRHVLLALAAGEPYRAARALAAEAAYAGDAGGRGARRSAHIRELAAQKAAEVGHPHAIGLATMAGGSIDLQSGKFRSALEECSAAERIFRDQCIGVAWEIQTAQLFASIAQAHLGELRALARRVPALVAGAHARGDLYGETNFRIGYPNLAWLVSGDAEGASRVANEALGKVSRRGFDIQHFFALLALVNIDLYRGDGAAALARLEEQRRALSRSLLLYLPFFRTEALWLRARAELAARRLESAEESAKSIAKEHMPWSDPLASIVSAAVHAMRGAVDAAVARLRESLAGFEAAEMKACRAVAALRLGRLIGGDEGRVMIAEFDTFAREQEMRDPERLAAVFLPPFDRSD